MGGHTLGNGLCMIDNRTLITKAGLPRVQKKIDDLRGLGRNHFFLDVGGKRLGYCYVRKNACSSFKKMFLDLSPQRADLRPDERPIDFMRRHHRMSEQDFAGCDHVIFVYRDPIQRTMSMFRNKFIACTGATDIDANFTKLEGIDPAETTFRYFVESYLQRSFANLDRHVLPQSIHLRRTIYTDFIEAPDLHTHMCRILGKGIGDTYFQRPVNQTSHVRHVQLDGAADMPIGDIRRIYADTDTMPEDASFLVSDLRDKVKARYFSDYDVIRRAEAASVQ
jgi:hypothetical protein